MKKIFLGLIFLVAGYNYSMDDAKCERDNLAASMAKVADTLDKMVKALKQAKSSAKTSVH